MSKRKKLTRTEIAIDNAQREAHLEQTALDFAEAMAENPRLWRARNARLAMLKAAVSYWRGVQR